MKFRFSIHVFVRICAGGIFVPTRSCLLKFTGAAGLLLGISLLPVQAQELNLQWTPREDLNVLLPPSVRIVETNGYLSDRARVRAMYATVDLRDRNLKLRAVGSNTLRQTTQEAYQEHNGILAINGGYFSSTASVSLLLSDGEVVAPGHQRELTRGAFGLVNGKPEIVWPYAVAPENALYKYPDPNLPGSPNPTATSPKGATRWLASQAVGGGPVLVKAGKIRDTSKEEGFGGSHLKRHPRTAIGYLDEHTLLMMVVDGRQETSAGVTIKELARMMLEAGCYEAVNLDGGGSSAMVAANEVVNIPADIPNGNRNSLRENASAIILAESKPSVNKEVLYIDTDSHYYNEAGLWKSSNHVNHYGHTRSRLASAEQEYNKAVYAFDSIHPGHYQLAAWWTVNEEVNTGHALYILHHGNKTDTLHADQTALSSSGKWNVLGDFILGPGDYLELAGKGRSGKLVADAIRLVAHEKFPEQPRRGDLRIAVISDLNAGLGTATYEWQVDSIIRRIPRLWKPDLVLCGGDMVAGMGVSDTATLTAMWRGFDQHIAIPLRKAGIPFAFTLGNHDGPRSYPIERKATTAYWNKPAHDPGLKFVDRTHFPHYYSFLQDGVFFVSWDASSPEITAANLEWMKDQFEKPEAKNATFRFVLGHMPLYSVAQERDSKGNVLENPEKLRQLLQEYNVHTYISGHQHAYYPGKRGALQVLNAGAAGSGPRRWLSIENDPVNTVTIMDLFYDRDTVVYTTYDIRHREAKDMTLFDEKVLPGIMFGVNGYVIRRDIRMANKATASLSALHTARMDLEPGSGEVRVEVKGHTLLIHGSFTHLKNKLLTSDDAIALYTGRNTEEGQLLQRLTVQSKNGRSGTFSGKIALTDDIPELLSAGALFVMIKTGDHPKGALRAQLYPAGNHAPAPATVSSHASRNVYAVRNIEALYPVTWDKAIDPDGDFVTHIYQLAGDAQFKDIRWQKNTGRLSHLKMLEQDWYRLLGNVAEGTPVTFYHRIITTDGKHITFSPGTRLQLMKSHEPLEDFIEVPAPDYTLDSKIANATGAGSGALWDMQGKLWLADYGGTLTVKQKDGTDASFSPLKAVTIKGITYSLKPINGIGRDLDGNILIGRNRNLIKVNAATGEGIAVWEVPEGKRAITSPRVNDKGEIYCMSLFAEDPNYVVKQRIDDSTTFEVLHTIALKDRILARTFDMSADGLTFYFPDPGSPFIQKYTSEDGFVYKKEDNITSTAAGCNAIYVQGHTLYAAVRSGGIGPSTFHFRDDVKKVMWTLPLPEVNGAEARGITVSENGDSIIFCSWDKGGGFYHYVLRPDQKR